MLHQFESVARRIQDDFEKTKRLPHQGLKGTARERAVVVEFLRQYLPKKYAIGSGIVMNHNAQYSKQQDIVIYDGTNFPVLEDYDEMKVFFAEQVFVALEVKSNLNHCEVRDVLEKAHSLHDLRLTFSGKVNKSITESDEAIPNSVFMFAFVYTSTTFTLEQCRDYIQQVIHSTERDWGISALLILSDKAGETGVITNMDRRNVGVLRVDPTIDRPLANVIVKNQGSALFTFYLLLMQALEVAETNLRPPDYLAYARTAGFSSVNMFVGKLGAEMLDMSKAVDIVCHPQGRSDDELIMAYRYSMQQSIRLYSEDMFFKDSTRFAIGNQLISDPRPKEIWESLIRYETGVATQMDRKRLDILVSMIRKTATENSHMDIVSP